MLISTKKLIHTSWTSFWLWHGLNCATKSILNQDIFSGIAMVLAFGFASEFKFMHKVNMEQVIVCLFVCFINKSFLTYSFVLPTPTLSTICRPLSNYTCSITPETVNVGSSYSHMRGPGVGCWLSDRSNCSRRSFEAAVLTININTDQWEPIVIYHSLTGRYTTMQPTLLTSWFQLLSYKV